VGINEGPQRVEAGINFAFIHAWHWPVRVLCVFARAQPQFPSILVLFFSYLAFAICYLLFYTLGFERFSFVSVCTFKSQSNNNKNFSEQAKKVIGDIVLDTVH